MDNVEEFRRQIIRAVWPGILTELEAALKALSINLVLALKVFSKHCEADEDWFREIRFYRYATDPSTHEKLAEEYEQWIDEQSAFLFEAAKCANWMADVVRRELNPMFFAIPGKFVVTTGPNMSMQFVTQALEYSTEEKKLAHHKATQALNDVVAKQRELHKELWGD
jgi:hypothetical protein